jgi:acetylornithine deacetylase
MVMNAKHILSDLVRIDSTSILTNLEIVRYAAAYLDNCGLTVKFHPYKDNEGVDKINLVASSSTSNSEVELGIVGHTDTVPFDKKWAEATTLVERDGKLFGRGACDTKGFIAATMSALSRYQPGSFKKPIAVILTADEEIGCIGAKKLVEQKIISPRYSIVGEPTSLTPVRATKGYCLADLVITGKEAHSAYPALGTSAIYNASKLIQEIYEIQRRVSVERHPSFDPEYTTINVGLIRGGTAKNIIAGECRFTLEWRPIPGQRVEYVLELIERSAEELKRADSSFLYRIEPLRLDGGVETGADSPLVRLMEKLSGQPSTTVSFATEAPQMADLGSEPVIFGPGSIKVAHQTGEFVPVSELEKCTELISQAIEHFCMN